MRADQLPLWERTLIASYHWRRVAPIPVARLRKPLGECRAVLVTTAGLVPRGTNPFDLGRLGGDPTFRVVPGDSDVSSLELHHRSQAFDRSAVASDPNVAFPLERLRERVAARELGDVAPRHLSFMGSITAPARLRKEHAPAAADLLVADAVDIALLAPVWPFCHQTVGLVAAELERRGIVTASVSIMPEITKAVGVSRTLVVPFGLGCPFGSPGDATIQTRVFQAVVALCERPDVPVMESFGC